MLGFGGLELRVEVTALESIRVPQNSGIPFWGPHTKSYNSLVSALASPNGWKP